MYNTAGLNVVQNNFFMAAPQFLLLFVCRTQRRKERGKTHNEMEGSIS
jgi:hypothetical protein